MSVGAGRAIPDRAAAQAAASEFFWQPVRFFCDNGEKPLLPGKDAFFPLGGSRVVVWNKVTNHA